jgi:hypothetical protein
MINLFSLVKGVGLGAGMMYFFDPIAGNRRRALIRDQITHACSVSNKQAASLYRDATNRIQGVKAEISSLAQNSEQGIVERVQEGARNVGRTLGGQGERWSPTAKAAAAIAGAGLVASLMNKRDVMALAFGAAGLTMMAKEVADLECARTQRFDSYDSERLSGWQSTDNQSNARDEEAVIL